MAEQVKNVRVCHLGLRKILVKIETHIEELNKSLKNQETSILTEFQTKASVIQNMEQSQAVMMAHQRNLNTHQAKCNEFKNKLEAYTLRQEPMVKELEFSYADLRSRNNLQLETRDVMLF